MDRGTPLPSSRILELRPAKRPHVQQFTDRTQVQWDWLTKESEYRATISKLEKQVRELQFENSLQVAADEGEKKKLAKENEALRAQIQKLKVASKNPARSDRDEKLIANLRQKVSDYSFDLNKEESELAKAQKQLSKSADEWVRLVKQLRERYDDEVVGLKKRVIAIENKMIKQAKHFKEQNYAAEQTLEVRSQQIGHLLQEKGAIRERIRSIDEYIVMKCQICEDMTRTTFFATIMTFVKQIMNDLDRLQRELTYRSAARPNDVPRTLGALMYS
ncbi:uncharacterized protein [Nicotiana sylvestris]|uniref:uncharacterized protein n=1 Tax=Nicotiana sylvestris TaxID=4096 RepID=UPI00388CD758